MKNIMNKLNKVPEVTIVFWIIKMMATTVGETAADFLSFNLKFGIDMTCYLMTGLLLVALWFQVALKKYIPAPYWVAVVLISVVGTLITDNMVDNLGISLVTTTIGFSLALAATFAAWYAREKTLSIHSINTTKRELFYWAAILFTFALGTAAGDLTAEGLGLGYATAMFIFGGLIAAIAACYKFLKMDAVLAFWLAYILTRPFGASIGDWLSQPVTAGGLGLGTTGTSVVFLATIIGLVGYLSVQENRKVSV